MREKLYCLPGEPSGDTNMYIPASVLLAFLILLLAYREDSGETEEDRKEREERQELNDFCDWLNIKPEDRWKYL